MSNKLIQFVTYSQANLIDLAGPFEVFLMANYFACPDTPPYSLSIIALDDTATILPGTFLTTTALDADTPKPHTLIIPGGPGIHDFCKNPKFESSFKAHAENAERLVSVCTGVFALAAAGKLAGKKATTHWSAYDELEQCDPSIIVERGPIFLNHGNVWTSAGVTSGIDLALSLVESDLGHRAALEVARHLVVFLKRPGNQDQFSTSLKMQSRSVEFSDLHAWVKANLANDLSVSALAAHMNMTERTLMRRYQAGTGQTLSKMVEMLRMEEARRLLLNTACPLKEISNAAGLGTETHLIRRFSKAFGTTPGEYRARFKSTS